MSEPKRHHYLPVFYLSRWIAADGRVFRYHRPYGPTVVSRRAPEHTGFEEGLYTLDGAARPQEIETAFFSLIDNDAAPVLEELIAQGPARLSAQKREVWTRFVMSLQLRSPHSVAEIKTVAEQFIRVNIEKLSETEYLAIKQEGDPDSAYEYALQRIPQMLANAHKVFLPGLIDDQEIGERIINMRWAVLNLSTAPHMLLTADRPFTTSGGLLDRRCLLGVPLSPTHLFVAANEIEQLYRLQAQTPKDTVRNANNLMVKLAVQNVYGCTDAHLAFVEKRLRRADEPPVPGVITR